MQEDRLMKPGLENFNEQNLEVSLRPQLLNEYILNSVQVNMCKI